ncbi:MAG: hypothetical protein PHH93_11490 [Prolixibacteraceae bacterium]|nr:hypothetical protein [Prolixibacteraceae bacterium]
MQDKTDKRVKLLILSEKGEKELDLSMKRIDETKKKGMVLSDKVFSNAIAIRNGKKRSPRDNNHIK